MRNVRLVITYEGTNYLGWQTQPHGPTIQSHLEEALLQLTGKPTEVLGAGRTDAGVHALGQVANFYTESTLSCFRLRLAIQAFLPKDIVILNVEDVPEEFHSRFQAVRKRYRYVFDNHPLRLPFWAHLSQHERRRLDAEKMHAAAQSLVGTHDFRSFESHWPNKAHSVRTVMSATVSVQPGIAIWQQPELSRERQCDGTEGEGRFVCLEISADGFLYNMVRCIAGTLREIGIGRWDVPDMERILNAQSRKAAGMTAAAQGLFLVQVDYPE